MRTIHTYARRGKLLGWNSALLLHLGSEHKHLPSLTSTIQSRFPSLWTNTSAGLGSLSSGTNQTPIPEEPLVTKLFPVSAAVLKLDDSTSSDYLLTIVQFFFWGLLDAPLFSPLFSPMGGETFLVSWLWWFLPICFYVGVHRSNPQLLVSMLFYGFWGFLSSCPWLLDHPILFTPSYLSDSLSNFPLSAPSPCRCLKKWLFSHILSSAPCLVLLYTLSWVIYLPPLLFPPSSSFWSQYE